MIKGKHLIKILSIMMILAMMSQFSAQAKILGTKNVGKITMIASLSIVSFIVKKLVDQDVKETIKLKNELGKPDSYFEFQEGFDNWRIEWHGEFAYVFRNGVFSHKYRLK